MIHWLHIALWVYLGIMSWLTLDWSFAFTADGSWWRFWCVVCLLVGTAGALLTDRRMALAGYVAAGATALSGLLAGADQAVPLVSFDFPQWPVTVVAVWVLAAWVLQNRPMEMVCAIAVALTYISRVFTFGGVDLRLLGEVFLVLLLLCSAGGIGGRIGKMGLGYWSRIGPASHRRVSGVAGKASDYDDPQINMVHQG